MTTPETPADARKWADDLHPTSPNSFMAQAAAIARAYADALERRAEVERERDEALKDALLHAERAAALATSDRLTTAAFLAADTRADAAAIARALIAERAAHAQTRERDDAVTALRNLLREPIRLGLDSACSGDLRLSLWTTVAAVRAGLAALSAAPSPIAERLAEVERERDALREALGGVAGEYRTGQMSCRLCGAAALVWSDVEHRTGCALSPVADPREAVVADPHVIPPGSMAGPDWCGDDGEDYPVPIKPRAAGEG